MLPFEQDECCSNFSGVSCLDMAKDNPIGFLLNRGLYREIRTVCLGVPSEVFSLLDALWQARLNDFEQARRLIMEADLPKPLGQALLSWFDCLMEGQARMEKPLGTSICNGVQSLGAHLLHIIETQALRGDLPEALASLFCLKEFLVRLCFESLCHVWAGDLRGQNTNSISAVEEACRKLGSPRQPNSPLTLETIRLALEKAMPDNPLHVWVRRLYQAGSNGQSLMEIRHKSRVAHGHCAVALDAPELSGWPGGWNEVMESARQTAQSVLGFLPVSPYEAAFEYIVSECRPIWINHHEDAYFKT